MSNFTPKNWSQSLKKFEYWSLTREILEQYLTKKQNGYLQSGRFYGRWWLTRSGRYEIVDCIPLALVGYEIVKANSALLASLTISHLM